MAFKKKTDHKEKVEPISMIDMIFILLAFFLVTSYVMKMPLQERMVSIPTPENVRGRAQIVIQFIDENRVFWLNDSAADIVKQISDDRWDLSPKQLQRLVVETLIQKNTLDYDGLVLRLEELKEQAKGNPNSNYFVQIRCPNDLPYQKVIDVITQLADTQYRNIKYGCVGGTLDDIRNCREIKTVAEVDRMGRRRLNLQIDF